MRESAVALVARGCWDRSHLHLLRKAVGSLKTDHAREEGD